MSSVISVSPITVLAISDTEEMGIDEFYGLFCDARQEGYLLQVPLGEVEVKKGNPNRRLIEDYSYWFW